MIAKLRRSGQLHFAALFILVSIGIFRNVTTLGGCCGEGTHLYGFGSAVELAVDAYVCKTTSLLVAQASDGIEVESFA